MTIIILSGNQLNTHTRFCMPEIAGPFINQHSKPLYFVNSIVLNLRNYAPLPANLSVDPSFTPDLFGVCNCSTFDKECLAG